MGPCKSIEATIEAALRASARHVQRTPAGDWRLTVANGTAFDVRARIADGEWLEMTARSPKASAPRGTAPPWSLLCLNARLTGYTRLATRPGGDTELRAELFVGASTGEPVDGERPLETDVAALCENLRRAHCETRALGSTTGCPLSPWPDPTEGGADEIARLCAEAGWSATSHASGEVTVPLAGRADGFDVCLTFDGRSRLRAVVPVTAGPVASGASRAALASLLLEVSSAVRMVKGVVFRRGDVDVAGIAMADECPAPSPAAIDRALAALAVACGLAGREAQVLQDDALARSYLALRHPSWEQVDLVGHRATEMEDTPCQRLP